MATFTKSARTRRSGGVMVDLHKKMRCISGFLRIFHGHAPSRKHLKTVLEASESPLTDIDHAKHRNGEEEDGSEIGDWGNAVSPVRKKLDCTIHEIDLIPVEDDGNEEDNREEAEAEATEVEGGGRSNPWRKPDQTAEVECTPLLLHTSSASSAAVPRLHRSNSSPEQRSLQRSNGVSAHNVLYHSRSPLLLQPRRSSLSSSAQYTEKNIHGASHSSYSFSSVRRGSTELFSSTPTTNPTSTITTFSATTTTITDPIADDSAEKRSSSPSSSSATFVASESHKRRSTMLAEWKKSLKILSSKRGSEHNVGSTQEMLDGITPPYSQNPNLNTKSPYPALSTAAASSRPNNHVNVHSVSKNSFESSNTPPLPNHHQQASSPSPSTIGRVSYNSYSSSPFESVKDSIRWSIGSSRSVDHSANNYRNNEGSHDAPRFSLDDRDILLMQGRNHGFCYRCNLHIRNHHHHHHHNHNHHCSTVILDQNYCSCSSASPSNPRPSAVSLAPPRLDDVPALFRSKSYRECNISNTTCNQLPVDTEKMEKKSQNKLMAIIMTMKKKEKKKKAAVHDDNEQVKCCHDLSESPASSLSSSSSCVSAIRANSVSAVSPSICSSSSSSLTQKLLQTVAQGSFIRLHCNPSQSLPSSPLVPSGCRSSCHGVSGTKLLQPKKQIRDGLPPIVILKQQKQSVLLPSKIHGNTSSSQRYKISNPIRNMMRKPNTDPFTVADYSNGKPERKTLKQILEALEKKGLLIPQPYSTKLQKPELDHQSAVISSDSTHSKMKAQNMRSHNYYSADRIVIMKPLPYDVSTKQQKYRTKKNMQQKKKKKRKMMVLKKKKTETKIKLKKKKQQKQKHVLSADYDLIQKQTAIKLPPQSSSPASAAADDAHEVQQKQTAMKFQLLSSSSSSSESSSPVSVLDKLRPADGLNDSDKEEEEEEEEEVITVIKKERNAEEKEEDEERDASLVLTTEEWNRGADHPAMADPEDDKTTPIAMLKSTQSDILSVPLLIDPSSSASMAYKELRSNKEFLYTEHVMKASGFMVEFEPSCKISFAVDEFAMAAWWLDNHHKNDNNKIVGVEVYDELEGYWEDVADKQLAAEQNCIEQGHGRDMGGELYRKSREMAIRRKLLFDCVNEVLGGIVGALMKKAIAMEPSGYGSINGNNDEYSKLRRSRSREGEDVVRVWRAIEAMEGAMVSSINESRQMLQKKKKENDGDMEELLLLLMSMNMREDHGHGYDDGNDNDDEDKVVALVAGELEREILDSIVQDLLPLHPIP